MFNFSEKIYCFYMKFGDNLLYVYCESNYLFLIIRNIFVGINRCILFLLLDQNVFDFVVLIYQKVFDESGYNYKLVFELLVENG